MKVETNANFTILLLGYFWVLLLLLLVVLFGFCLLVYFFVDCVLVVFLMMVSILLFTSRPNVLMYVHCIFRRLEFLRLTIFYSNTGSETDTLGPRNSGYKLLC